MTLAGRWLTRWLLLAAMIALAVPVAAEDSSGVDAADRAELKQQAMVLAERFAGTLKPRLLQALQQDGAVHAISVCAEEAPAIAATLSAESGWHVSRVSLRPRNPNAAPDGYQQRVLQRFDAEVAAGNSPEPVFSTQGDEAILLVPQLTGPLCLTCHGEPTTDVTAALREHYPQDAATGYVSGQVRGALSLRKTIHATADSGT